MRNQRIAIAVTSIIAGLAGANSAGSAEVEWALGLATRYTDNIDMVPRDEDSEITLIPSASLGILHEGPRLYADVSGLVRYYEYTKNTNDNEDQYYADAVLSFSLIPDFLDWRVEDHLSNEPIFITETDTPENRQNVNVFYTGPEMTIRMGRRNELILSGGYINTLAEETDTFDSDRWLAQAEFIHSVSERIDIGAGAEYEDVDFDNRIEAQEIDRFVDGDYDRVDYYGIADLTRGANNLRVEAGYTDIDFVKLPDDDGQRIYALFTREVSEDTTWDLTYRDLLTDAARGVEGEPALGLGGVDVSADVYRVTEGAFHYSGQVWQTELDLNLGAREEDYLNADFRSRDVAEVVMDIVQPLTPRMDFISTLSWADYDYENLRARRNRAETRDDTEIYAIVGLRFQLQRRLQLRTQIGWHDIDSNDPGSDADEKLAQISLVWGNRLPGFD